MNGRRITADRDRCIGAGMCALLAGSIFDQDDGDGRVLVLDPVPRGELGAVLEAVAVCPSGALSLDEG
ncbi:ferredoxin [Nocardia rhizosphaerae]|uniref:Ferredoxin n=1 Tax=Nocardia rhizosphaerae TaxID=1691571 RepID=A0ABV8L5S9_9NOCA